MADIMKITKSRMTGFADQARRLGGIEGELSPAQIESTLAGVTAGGSGDAGLEDVLINRTLTEYTNSTVSRIGYYAFASCSKLTSVSFPACTNIDNSAFLSCTKLTTANFPACKKVGASAFYNCINLTSVSFPACTNISAYAFQNCRKLTSVSFPACTSINASAFIGCSSLTTANFPACKNVGASAFASCSNLTSVSFPACTNIDNSAFFSCTKLTTANFPACKNVGASAFQNCRQLTSVSFPACTNIDTGAFRGCSILSIVTLGASIVCSLTHSNAFFETPFTGVSTFFSGIPYIYTPYSLMASYKVAANWSYYSNYFNAIESAQPGITLDVKENISMLFNNVENVCAGIWQCESVPDVHVFSNDESIVSVSNIQTTSSQITFDIITHEIEGEAIITVSAVWDNETYTKTVSVAVYETLPAPIITIESVDGATYGFELNDNGYYESTNKGQGASCAICKVNVDAKTDCIVYLDCINDAESGYDYGILSTLDNTLSLDYSEDSINVQKSFKDDSITDMQTINYNVPAGEHFIYVKFIKDGGSNYGNDSLQFKVRYEI